MADDEVTRRLDELNDLFARRLLDDRQKRATIESLQHDLDAARRGLAAEYLIPLVRGLALVVDRLDRYEGADAEFTASVRAELVDLLDRHGVTEIDASGPFDAARHEAVATTESAVPEGHIVEVRRRGFAHGTTVLRPAQVVVSSGDGAT